MLRFKWKHKTGKFGDIYRIKIELDLNNCEYIFSQGSVCVLIKINFKNTLNELRKKIFNNIVRKNGILKDEFKRYNINWNDVVIIYRNRELIGYDKSIYKNINKKSYYENQIVYCKGILVKNDKKDKSLVKSNKYVVNIYVEYNKYCYHFGIQYILRSYIDSLNLCIPLDIMGIIKKYFNHDFTDLILPFGYIILNDLSVENIQNKIISQMKYKIKTHHNVSYVFPFIKSNGMVTRYYSRYNDYDYTIGSIMSTKEKLNIKFWKQYNPSNCINIYLQKVKELKTLSSDPNTIFIDVIFHYNYPQKYNFPLSLDSNTQMNPVFFQIIADECNLDINNIIISKSTHIYEVNSSSSNDISNISDKITISEYMKSDNQIHVLSKQEFQLRVDSPILGFL